MWRRTGSLPFLWREGVVYQAGCPCPSGQPTHYQNVRHQMSRFHRHITYNRLGNTKPRTNLVDPKLVKKSILMGDMVEARRFEFTVDSLNARGTTVPSDPRQKYELLTKAVETFQHGVSKSVTTAGNTTNFTKQRKSSAKTRRTSSSVKTVPSQEDDEEEEEEESFPITAYALCDEFDLKGLRRGLIAQGLYIPTVLSDDLSDVIHVSAKYPIGDEDREIFFFREGAVVFWNVPYLERVNVLKFLKPFQDESYGEEDIEDECEYMNYTRSDQGTRLLRGKVILGDDSTNKILEKYTFANALASSVKLGIWESTLEKYVEGIEHITEALKRAEDIKLSRGEVLQKTGELFALRHQLNLNSDLLDTPDFYWERERLETLYKKTCDYLSIHRRTKVMNEKLTQCCELLDLISSHLTDQHHTRLEWMIIVLIMIEVGFEILHLLERYELVHI